MTTGFHSNLSRISYQFLSDQAEERRNLNSLKLVPFGIYKVVSVLNLDFDRLDSLCSSALDRRDEYFRLSVTSRPRQF